MTVARFATEWTKNANDTICTSVLHPCLTLSTATPPISQTCGCTRDRPSLGRRREPVPLCISVRSTVRGFQFRWILVVPGVSRTNGNGRVKKTAVSRHGRLIRSTNCTWCFCRLTRPGCLRANSTSWIRTRSSTECSRRSQNSDFVCSLSVISSTSNPASSGTVETDASPLRMTITFTSSFKVTEPITSEGARTGSILKWWMSESFFVPAHFWTHDGHLD